MDPLRLYGNNMILSDTKLLQLSVPLLLLSTDTTWQLLRDNGNQLPNLFLFHFPTTPFSSHFPYNSPLYTIFLSNGLWLHCWLYPDSPQRSILNVLTFSSIPGLYHDRLTDGLSAEDSSVPFTFLTHNGLYPSSASGIYCIVRWLLFVSRGKDNLKITVGRNRRWKRLHYLPWRVYAVTILA